MLAAGLDAAVGVTAALPLASSLGWFFATRAVVTLRIGMPGTLWQGPVPMLLGAVGEVVYLLPCTLWAAWLLDPLTGATIGARVVGLRVVGRHGEATPADRWRRHLVQTVPLWGWVLALLAGRWELALLASAAGIVVAIGMLAAIGPAGLTLHDRLTGTAVVRHDRTGLTTRARR